MAHFSTGALQLVTLLSEKPEPGQRKEGKETVQGV